MSRSARTCKTWASLVNCTKSFHQTCISLEHGLECLEWVRVFSLVTRSFLFEKEFQIQVLLLLAHVYEGFGCSHLALKTTTFVRCANVLGSKIVQHDPKRLTWHLKWFYKLESCVNIHGPMWVLICGLLRFSSVSQNSTGSSILTTKKVIFFECLLLSGLLNANVRCDVWTFQFRKSLTVIVKMPCV